MISAHRLAARFLGFFAVLFLAGLPWQLGADTPAITHRYESIHCGSVIAPKQEPLFPYPQEAQDETMDSAVARQAACAEARSIRLGRGVRSAAIGGVFGAAAVFFSRRHRQGERPADGAPERDLLVVR